MQGAAERGSVQQMLRKSSPSTSADGQPISMHGRHAAPPEEMIIGAVKNVVQEARLVHLAWDSGYVLRFFNCVCIQFEQGSYEQVTRFSRGPRQGWPHPSFFLQPALARSRHCSSSQHGGAPSPVYGTIHTPWKRTHRRGAELSWTGLS